MLPPGHIAAGFITADAIIKLVPYKFSIRETHYLLALGTMLAFVPDLDFFYVFSRVGDFKIDNSKENHRTLFTHAPVVWLVLGLIVFAFAKSPFYKVVGLEIWLCTWSHFIVDSEWGIMWLWPFSKKFFPFSHEFYVKKYQQPRVSLNKSFWVYWWDVLKDHYSKKQALIEIFIIIVAIIILFKH